MSTQRAFWQGFWGGAPFILVVAPFGLVFGVVATDAGFSVTQALAFSGMVVAGAAQLTAVQLLTENAPVAIVIATALAVNLRMAMYSASLAPHLGKASVVTRLLVSYQLVDQAYALAHQKFEQSPSMPLNQKLAFFFGIVTPIFPFWMTGTLVGAVLSSQIPASIPIAMAVPITFLAMVGPMLRTLAHVAACFVSVVGALVFQFLPYGTGLLVAALLAMLTGAWVETWMNRRGVDHDTG
jgi:predicted branched-subunit amino acid permease